MANSVPSGFSVVDFPEEKSLAVVSSSWLQVNHSTCLWPNCSLFDVPRLAKRHATPQPNWKPYPYRLKSSHGSYDEANRAMIVYQYTSNEDTSAAESSIETKRTRTRTQVSRKKITGPSLVAVTGHHSSSSSGSESEQDALSNVTLKSFITGTSPSQSSYSTAINIQNLPSQPAGAPVNLLALQHTSSNELCNSSSTVQFLSSGSNQSESATPAAVLDVLKSMQAEQRRSQQTMIDYVIQIVGNQEELLRRTVTEAGPASKRVKLSVDIPIQTLEEFHSFNDWLGTSENLEALSKQLQVIGGSSVSSITQRILGSLISNTVSLELSLTGVGTKTKAGLKGTFILDLIYDIVRNTRGGTEATNHEIDLAIQKWLKGASDRQGGRDKRRTKKRCGELNQHQQGAHNVQSEGDV